ncbi:hypothetical protein KJ836_03555 [Patescibacteria group bacterium]|nr:hypothetical protein [Patescibacteria group bacterium]
MLETINSISESIKPLAQGLATFFVIQWGFTYLGQRVLDKYYHPDWLGFLFVIIWIVVILPLSVGLAMPAGFKIF